MKRSISILFALLLALVFLPAIVPASDLGAPPPSLSQEQPGCFYQEFLGAVIVYNFVKRDITPMPVPERWTNLHSSRIKIWKPSSARSVRYAVGPPSIVRKWRV